MSYLGQSVCWHGRCFPEGVPGAGKVTVLAPANPRGKGDRTMKVTKLFLLSAAVLAFAALPAMAQLGVHVGGAASGTTSAAGNTVGGTLGSTHDVGANGQSANGLGA